MQQAVCSGGRFETTSKDNQVTFHPKLVRPPPAVESHYVKADHTTTFSACPQCDATFTRVRPYSPFLNRSSTDILIQTDAQRRHQKSRYLFQSYSAAVKVVLTFLRVPPFYCRHNGVIIEAVETTTEGDENSSSRSRSGTPLSKTKVTNVFPVQEQPSVPASTGPSSYYRQHTALTNRKLDLFTAKLRFLIPLSQRTYHRDCST